MKYFKVKTFVMLLSVTVLLAVSVVTPFAEAADLKVLEMAVTTKIVKGKPIDSVHRISSSSVKELFCFTRTYFEEGGETTIKHVWYRNNEKVSESELPVKGERWRTFSRRGVSQVMAGDWRVDALDSEGKLLKSVKFRMN